MSDQPTNDAGDRGGAAGASAGGLEAYAALLDALPADRESLVADILSRHAAMPVAQVAAGRPVDDFVWSLAEEQQRAIAVVLSGMGPAGAGSPPSVAFPITPVVR